MEPATVIFHTSSTVMESSTTCHWPRGSSRTISIVLGLGLMGYVLGLGLVDKVLEFTKDTNTSSADALNVPQNCRTNSTNPMKYFGLLTMCHDTNYNFTLLFVYVYITIQMAAQCQVLVHGRGLVVHGLGLDLGLVGHDPQGQGTVT